MLCLLTDLYNNILLQHNGMDHIKLQLLFEEFLILRRTELDAIKNVNRSSRKVPAILVRFE